MNTFTKSLALLVLCAGTAVAQKPAAKPAAKPDSIITQLVGTWEGPVYSDHGADSNVQLVFTFADSLNVKMALNFGGQMMPTGDATNMKVDGNAISWTVVLMEQSCKATGMLIAGALKGDMTCPQGAITYLARKK